MEKERIKEIYKEFEDKYNCGCKNEVVAGLVIMSKCCDDINIVPAHDEIFAYLKDSDYGNMTESDVRAIFDLNWCWNEEFEGFHKFV